MISSQSSESVATVLGALNRNLAPNWASATYPTSNQAFYVPFILSEPLLVDLLWWRNGTAVSGSIDVGLYTADGTRLTSSGSTAQSGTNAIQSADITNILLGRGVFYLAVAMDNTTGTLFRFATGNAAEYSLAGLLTEASAFALPATATFATMGSTTYVPLIGLTGRTFV